MEPEAAEGDDAGVFVDGAYVDGGRWGEADTGCVSEEGGEGVVEGGLWEGEWGEVRMSQGRRGCHGCLLSQFRGGGCMVLLFSCRPSF